MDRRALFKLALLGAALYLLWRVWTSARAQQPGQGSHGVLPPRDPLDPLSGIAGRDSTPTPDVAGDVTEDEPDFWLQNLKFGHDGFTPELQTRFYRQVILPSSKIPVRAIGRDDVVLALKLIAGQLNRANCPKSDGEQRQQAMEDSASDAWDAVGWILVVVKVVMSICGVGALSDIFSAEATSGQKDAAKNAADAADAALKATEAFRKQLDAHSLEAFAQFFGPVHGSPLSARPDVHDGTGPETLDLCHAWIGQGATSDKVGGQIGGDPTVAFYPRMAFLDRNIQRFRFGFVSQELGCGATLRERVNRRARVYRTLDMIGCLLFPSELHTIDAQTGAVRNHQEQYLYTYLGGGTVPLVGSIFPPTSEDAFYNGHESDGIAPPPLPKVDIPGVAPDITGQELPPQTAAAAADAAVVANQPDVSMAAAAAPSIAAPRVVPLPAPAPPAAPPPKVFGLRF